MKMFLNWHTAGLKGLAQSLPSLFPDTVNPKISTSGTRWLSSWGRHRRSSWWSWTSRWGRTWRTDRDTPGTASRSSSLMCCSTRTLNTTSWKVKLPPSLIIASLCDTFGEFVVRDSVLGILILQYRRWKGMKQPLIDPRWLCVHSSRKASRWTFCPHEHRFLFAAFSNVCWR